VIAFAQPWALLSLLSLPVLFYLYRLRPNREDAAVSSVMFWQQAIKIRESQRNFRRLLRDLNLILLLVLAMLIGLALAQPQWRVVAQQSPDAVLILDTSASMQARSSHLGRIRFDEAKSKARQIISALPEGTRLLLMTSARYARTHSGFESDRDLLQAIVSRLEPTDEAGNPRAAFTLARTLLRSREHAQLHFVTDGAFDTPAGLATAASEFHFVGEQRENIAITRFDVRTVLQADDEYEVFVAIRNFGDESVAAPLTLLIDGIELVERNVVIEARSEVTLSLPMAGRLVSRAAVRIEFDDALEVDNAAYMAFASPAPRRILLYTPGNFYLETALAELPDTLLEVRAPLDESQSSAQIAATMRGYDVVVFDRVSPPALEAGKFLFIDVGPAGSVLDVEERTAATGVSGVGDSALMRDLDLSQVRVAKPRNIQMRTNPTTQAASQKTVQRLFWSDDAELSFSTLQPDKRVVYLGFDLLDSNLPQQTAFPLFIRRSIEWLGASSLTSVVRSDEGDTRDRRRQIPVGESFTLEFPPGTEEITIATPDGSAEAMVLTSPRYTFDNTSRAGLYQYIVAGEKNYVAANLVDESESNINRRLASQPARTVNPSGTSAGIIKYTLWPYLAWLALLLLIIEWWLWCTRHEHA